MVQPSNIPSPLPNAIRVRTTMNPGDIGSIVYLHGTLYAAERGWDHTFEAYVAGPLSEFARGHTERERIWIVERDDKVCGSIAIVDAGDGRAQLRWLLLHPEIRGQGVGRRLIWDAIAFSREMAYSSILLWTERSLTAAARLYEAAGFELIEETTHELWGAVVTEQRYDLTL